MGFFSFLDKPFRTGRSSALRDAKAQSAQQQQQYSEFLDLIRPGVESGISAQQELAGYATPEGLGDLISGIQGGAAFSALADPIIEDRQRAASAALAGAGLRRSGSAIREAANIPTDVRTSITNDLLSRILGSTGDVARIGTGFTGSSLGALQGYGQAGQAGVQAGLAGAAGKAGIFSGLLNLGGSLGSAAILASDPKLKTNITYVGEIGDLNVYRWDWIPEIEDKMKEVPGFGFMADEVEQSYPEFLHHFILNGKTMRSIDYPGLIEHMKINMGNLH